eukprot:8712996-Pyramimonas_sp.AAC.1
MVPASGISSCTSSDWFSVVRRFVGRAGDAGAQVLPGVHLGRLPLPPADHGGGQDHRHRTPPRAAARRRQHRRVPGAQRTNPPLLRLVFTLSIYCLASCDWFSR